MLQYVGSTHRTPRRRPNRLVTMTISAVLKPLTGKLVRGFESHPRRFQPAWNGINEPAFARWEESATLPSASKCPRVPVHTANRQSHARSRARPASDRVRRLPDQSRALIVDALGLPLEGSWPRRSCDWPSYHRVPGLTVSPVCDIPRSFSPYPRTPTPPGMPGQNPPGRASDVRATVSPLGTPGATAASTPVANGSTR